MNNSPTMADELISIEAEVFELRFIMLLEDKPQSNNYNQLVLSEDQYKKINTFIKSLFPACKKPGHDPKCTEYVFEDCELKLPSEIRAYESVR